MTEYDFLAIAFLTALSGVLAVGALLGDWLEKR